MDAPSWKTLDSLSLKKSFEAVFRISFNFGLKELIFSPVPAEMILALTSALNGGSFSSNYFTKMAASLAHLLGGNLIDNLIISSGII